MPNTCRKEKAMMIAFQHTFVALKTVRASRRSLVVANKTKGPVRFEQIRIRGPYAFE